MSALRVLLLEDLVAYAELVQVQLEETMPEASVTGCTTLRQAQQLLADQRWDVVLADLALPDADGLDVVRSLHAACPDTALVVLTGRADGQLALESLAEGAQEYLVKGADDGARLATVIRHAVQRSRTEQAARRYERLSRSLLDALDAPTCAVDRDSRIVAVNAAWEAASPISADPAAVGAHYLDVCAAAPADDDLVDMHELARGVSDVIAGRQVRCSVEYACPGPGEHRWFSARIAAADIDGGRGAVITHVDISDMHRAQQALTHQALHDALTGLPNRILLTDRLTQALSDSARRDSRLAVAFLDLDHFKRVNDSLGHPAGDALLVEVARRLRSHVRAGDTLGRYSGDEFVVIWRDLEDLEEAKSLSSRLCDALSRPFELGSARVTVGASIGVVLGSAPQTAEELLLAADAAMYDAKGHGRGRVHAFTSELRQGATERQATEAGLREALLHDELVLHYQPVVDVATSRPVAVEALVRWNHPERGLLGPDAFIPVAEATGLIVPLGRWVLEQACREAASWPHELDVAVNLSVRQLIQPDVLAHVRDALSHSGLPPRRLLLEVTESAVMEDAEAAGIALDALSRLGVSIAIDDFGTGYSSLLYLRRYPIQALKVDRAFVAGIATTPDDAAIVASVVSLAHAVGAGSIAEGVETVEQYAALRAVGCRQAQGYLWSEPVAAADLPAALAACRQIDLTALERARPAPPGEPAAPEEITRRIAALQAGGASLHTIAAALNKAGTVSPAGVRWHAQAVARVTGSPVPGQRTGPT